MKEKDFIHPEQLVITGCSKDGRRRPLQDAHDQLLPFYSTGLHSRNKKQGDVLHSFIRHDFYDKCSHAGIR